jgi:type II secretory pathway pseudopilin PulG
MMDVQKTKATLKTRKCDGFSIVEILIMATIVSIISAFGILGVTRARASVRLSGAAREYASYIEKARMHAIRSHADNADERAGVSINAAKNSYNVTLDLDGNGTMDTKTIPLPRDVTFETVETISFDWRGRTWNTVDGVTTPNAQVSIRLKNSNDSVSVDVTGSGDITIDSRVFDDSVPNVNLRVGDLASSATPTPTPAAVATPTPTPALIDGTQPTPTPTPVSDGAPVPTPTPNLGGGTPTPTPSPTATPRPSPSPSPTATPTPSPSPVTPCTITTDPVSLSLGIGGTKTIKVSHNSSSSVIITATSSKPSDLQVTPGSSTSIGAGGAATFTIKSKSSLGIYNVTFSTGCGSKVVPVVVLL